VAFSGGPDSTALLAAVARAKESRAVHGLGRVEVVAAHYDHALDSDSGRRAEIARRIASELDVPFQTERRSEALSYRRGMEAGARELRYRFLETVRRNQNAFTIATAHHRDDQIETVLLRLLRGSGIRGLAGMDRHRPGLSRPLLRVSRREIEASLHPTGISPVNDPTNLHTGQHTGTERNRIRHRLLPTMRAQWPGVEVGLLKLSDAAAGASRRIDRAISHHRDQLRREGTPPAHDASVHIETLLSLPEELQPFLLAELHRQAGAMYPPRQTAIRELRRQLIARPDSGVQVDCGDGWRWCSESQRLRTERADPSAAQTTPFFAYTLTVPGIVEIPEIAACLRLRRENVKPWMFRGSATRAALALPLKSGDAVEVRNRRPGDRLRPLGCDYERPLKEILIDSKVPRAHRSRIPLLRVDERIAWVPGITIDERFRLKNEAQDEEIVWTAYLLPQTPK